MGYETDNMSQQKEGADENDEILHKFHCGMHDGDCDILDSVISSYQISTAKNISSGLYAWAVFKGTGELDRVQRARP
eukprot:13835629-Heterocapsa_arctica.AAC.1